MYIGIALDWKIVYFESYYSVINEHSDNPLNIRLIKFKFQYFVIIIWSKI